MKKGIVIACIFLLAFTICTPWTVSAVPEESWGVTMYFTSLSNLSDDSTPPPAPSTYDRTFGVSSIATDAFDRDIDKVAPPAPQVDALDVYFPCEHEVVTRLANDIRSNDTDEWELILTIPSQSTGNLKWDIDSLPSDEKLTIVVDGSKTDMESKELLTFSSGTYNIVIEKGIQQSETKPANSPSGSSGGGGGGGSTTGEEFENIDSKYAQLNKVSPGEKILYEFNEEECDVMSIQFNGVTNSGQTKTSIEMLKSTSALVGSSAPGKVYRNLNIWVGDVAFDENDMENPVIGFKVSKEWISDNDIDPSSIVLCRYHDESWNQLSTRKTDENEGYFFYESDTPGFSPFAITAISEDIVTVKEQDNSEEVNMSLSGEMYSNEEGETNNIPGFKMLTAICLLGCTYLIRRGSGRQY